MPKLTAKEKIIDSTLEVMKGRGYRSVTVDEIITHAGVSKGSFYHAFKSKEELAMTALEVYGARGWALVANGTYRDIDDPVEKARAFAAHIERQSAGVWKHGSLIGTIALEVAESHPELISKIDQLMDYLETRAAEVFDPALRAIKVRRLTGKDLARHFLGIIEGSIVLAKAHKDPACLKQGINHFRRYLDFILDGGQ